MLIHVTRFTAVQDHVASQVSDELKSIRRRLEHGEGNSPTKLMGGLRQLWEQDFVPSTTKIADPLCPPADWLDVEDRLLEAASRIVVRRINGSVGDVLDYADQSDQGLSVIAVGGDKLSRGLTLEGLSISYYLRASRMYDTLMQMGRWFGYRPGYLDVCRLYTTGELIEWYEVITSANEELRKLFDDMAAEGGNPRDFGIRVRSHPDLLITSQVKMKHGYEIDISFDGDISETVVFDRNQSIVERNFEATNRFITDLDRHCVLRNSVEAEGATLVWDQVPPELVMTGFLSRMKVHERASKVRPELLKEYIARQVEKGELKEWTVALISKSSGHTWQIGRHEIHPLKRAFLPSKDAKIDQAIYRIRRLLNPKDEMIDLSDQQKCTAMEWTKEAWTPDPARSVNKTPTDPAGPQIRRVRDRTRGLLLIYPLVEDETTAVGTPFMGFALSFPTTTNPSKVVYRVNNTYWRLEYADE